MSADKPQHIIRRPSEPLGIKSPKGSVSSKFIERIKQYAMQIVGHKRKKGQILPDEKFSTAPKSEEELVSLVTASLKFSENGWSEIFRLFGEAVPELQNQINEYEAPKLSLYTGTTKTACGRALREMGPFYCPLDNKVYIDLSFFDEYLREFDGDAEDMVVAVVVAHEVSHHIQKFLGLLGKLQPLREVLPEVLSNKVQQIIELHADYLTGVCLHHANKVKTFLHENDIEEALRTALFIGDDIIQHRKTGRVTKYTFTHGSGEQRLFALKAGLTSGDWVAGLKIITDNLILSQVMNSRADENVIMFTENGPIHY